MKNLYLLFLICISYFNLNAQSNNHIVIGKIDSIESKILGEQRKVWVYVPQGGDKLLFAEKTYPVVYLLDGDSHFHSVVGMIQQLSTMNGNTICPKMIVVGIPNTNRTRDLTPTKGNGDHPFVDSSMIANSGGGSEFTSFMESELIPYIESNYPTEPYRMLIGHSFGGLTVMNIFAQQPELFSSYVAIDPSMWWDNQKLLKQIKETSFDEKYNNKSLYLAIANTLEKGMDTLSVQSDTTYVTEHMRSILDLNHVLNSKGPHQFAYKGKYYENDDHGSVPLIAEYDAIRFIFGFYRLKFETSDFLDPESNYATTIANHYIKLSEKFGREIKPDEEYINGLGYQFLSMQQIEKAEKFFKLNVANYPDSFNVYDSLGDLYAAQGRKEDAIKNYKISLGLNKDSPSKDKIAELQKE